MQEFHQKEKLDFTKIQTAIDALQEFNMRNEYRYLNNLLHPEKCKGVKIPSAVPVPSCSFQLHNCITVRTNSVGNLAIMFNPFFLGKTPDTGDRIPDGQVHVTNIDDLYGGGRRKNRVRKIDEVDDLGDKSRPV